jgi:hypothetical protein
MCDIQIITGLAIIISGFYALFQGLSAYHWQIVVFLTWFSTVTHLAGLTVLRAYFQSPTQSIHRAVRAFFMFALLALTVAAIVPTQYFSWEYVPNQDEILDGAPRPSDYAWCYFQPGFGHNRTSNAADAPADLRFAGISSVDAAKESFASSIALISVSFLVRVQTLFNIGLPRKWRQGLWKLRWTYDALFEKIWRHRFRPEAVWKIIHVLASLWRASAVAFYLSNEILLSLYSSMLSEVNMQTALPNTCR